MHLRKGLVCRLADVGVWMLGICVPVCLLVGGQVRTLLLGGADKNATNKWGKVPHEEARDADHGYASNILLAYETGSFSTVVLKSIIFLQVVVRPPLAAHGMGLVRRSP